MRRDSASQEKDRPRKARFGKSGGSNGISSRFAERGCFFIVEEEGEKVSSEGEEGEGVVRNPTENGIRSSKHVEELAKRGGTAVTE